MRFALNRGHLKQSIGCKDRESSAQLVCSGRIKIQMSLEKLIIIFSHASFMDDYISSNTVS